MKTHLEKLAGIGAVIAAAACPVCFPKLALLGAVFGLGALGAYESQLIVVAQALVVLAVLGHVLAYRRHRRRGLLALAILSGATVFGGLYLLASEATVYAGFGGLVLSSATGYWSRFRGLSGFPPWSSGKPESKPILESEITCPNCGHRKLETMPADACQFFYECAGCGAVLRPRTGDCCVFCSFGTVKCPPRQGPGSTAAYA